MDTMVYAIHTYYSKNGIFSNGQLWGTKDTEQEAIADADYAYEESSAVMVTVSVMNERTGFLYDTVYVVYA